MKARILFAAKIFAVIIISLVLAAVITLTYMSAAPETTQALTKIGSRGDDVRALQERLKRKGVYFGQVSGVFDGLTANALRTFQQRSGLTVDGTANLPTLSALGLAVYPRAGGSVSESEYGLLARFIEAEVGEAPPEAQTAAGAVLLNRISHPSFPDSLYAVIYRPGAFGSTENDTLKKPAGEDAYRAASGALYGTDISGGALYFCLEKDLPPSREVTASIGGYAFYR